MDSGFDSKFWQDRRVLVTGGTGLVGGWVIKRLLQAEADVVCLVRDWTPQSELVRSGDINRVTIARGDICDQACLERVLGEFEIETVINLAAQTIVGIANRNPGSTFEANVGGTWKLLEACRRSPAVKQIVMASSDKAYGAAKVLPYTEETPLAGMHPYDVSKSCGDLISQTYAHSYGLPVCITRCGNFYGGGDLNWNRILPGTIRSVLRGQQPVIRSDGSFIRDYFYVEDGAAAYMHLAEQMALKPELAGEAFNLSTEIQVSVLELVQRILQVMGSTLEPVVLGEASNEIKHQYLDAEKARRMLNWQPLYNLDEGLNRTIEWYKNYIQSTANHASHASVDHAAAAA
ncbi:MAG: NAD-dependent epimerase/dehydratase family protein [Fuerstiella sp.]|jgi:CDP-glucose 4,6-dehydratase|nr:NAD-dependent epimerase/dehydratase family protein [Fuerstiella sp.]MCP4507626.1 NAD-dependent epimerase/dehydratase family protein [Fuerstiella sp.]MDG2126612.1 GDP-mannose 4,6-dehydratase [Fuerstiella sp.]